MIREIMESERDQLFVLYTELHANEIPRETNELMNIWRSIMDDRNHHVIVAVEDNQVVSSCVCIIIPNLTHNQRPYALIENVVTKEEYRHRGLARGCLVYAKELAEQENCYKMMLLTGSKQESTLNFYRQAGYNSEDKTGFIQWME